MISKVEAEEKLLKIFYDVKLDRYYKKNPTRANIDIFEETKDPDHLDQLYRIKEGELVICMRANSYEHGISYTAVHMAHNNAKNWRDDPLNKLMTLYKLIHMILPLIILLNFLFYVRFYSLFIVVLIDILGTGIIIYFIVLKIKWKKRVIFRFRELFETTGIFLSEEKIDLHSRSLFYELIMINMLQGFTILTLLISWVSIFIKEV
ncbi:MAG: hypothetical protein ACTSWH_02215 [Promethearchaeota archaeon]